MPRVLAIGYLSIDTIVTPLGRHDGVPGGAALYAALGARRLGADVALSAAVGQDYPADWLERLAALGMDCTSVERRGGGTRRAQLEHAASGARRSHHHGRDEWWQRTKALAPPVPSALTRVDVIAAGPMPVEVLAEVVEAAERRAIPVVADTSEAFAARSRQTLLELLPRIAVFAPSREETRLLLPGLGDDAAAAALAGSGPHVLQKRGPHGALAIAGADRPGVLLPAPPAEVIDPTGAGDATVGALAAGLACGRSFLDAARDALGIGAVAAAGLGPVALGFWPVQDGVIGARNRA